MAVRHRTPVKVLEPFVNPLLEKGDALTVRAAEWLLRVDGAQTKALQVLIDLSVADKTADDLRIEASNALSRRLILPANGMPDEARKRGMKAIAKVIALNKASNMTILQAVGMASFCEADDLKVIQAASARVDKVKLSYDSSLTPELPYEK
jgi:dihydrodipicolinate reductase